MLAYHKNYLSRTNYSKDNYPHFCHLTAWICCAQVVSLLSFFLFLFWFLPPANQRLPRGIARTNQLAGTLNGDSTLITHGILVTIYTNQAVFSELLGPENSRWSSCCFFWICVGLFVSIFFGVE